MHGHANNHRVCSAALARKKSSTVGTTPCSVSGELANSSKQHDEKREERVVERRRERGQVMAYVENCAVDVVCTP
jgi:hypothetical protein